MLSQAHMPIKDEGVGSLRVRDIGGQAGELEGGNHGNHLGHLKVNP